MSIANKIFQDIVDRYFDVFILDDVYDLEFKSVEEAETYINGLFELAKDIEYELPKGFGFKICYEKNGNFYFIYSTNCSFDDNYKKVKVIFQKQS